MDKTEHPSLFLLQDSHHAFFSYPSFESVLFSSGFIHLTRLLEYKASRVFFFLLSSLCTHGGTFLKVSMICLPFPPSQGYFGLDPLARCRTERAEPCFFFLPFMLFIFLP